MKVYKHYILKKEVTFEMLAELGYEDKDYCWEKVDLKDHFRGIMILKNTRKITHWAARTTVLHPEIKLEKLIQHLFDRDYVNVVETDYLILKDSDQFS